MTKMSNLLFAGVLSASLIAPVMATEAQPQDALADAGLIFEVDGNQPMELAALSSQEMAETEGAWWFAPVIGFTAFGAGLGTYHSYRTTGSISWRDVGAGATAGFYASPMGRPFGTVGRFAMGSLGSYSWYW